MSEEKRFKLLLKTILLLMIITMALAIIDLRFYNYGLYFIPLGFMWLCLLILQIDYTNLLTL